MADESLVTAAEGEAQRVVSDSEAEIRALAQQLHDKIVALGGDNWIADLSTELKNARADVEDAIGWVVNHFKKQEGMN